SIDSLPNYELRHVFGHLGGGVAFDPLDDTLYAGNSFTDELVAYAPQTFQELFRLPVGEHVVESAWESLDQQLISSPDGNFLALLTASGVRVFRIRPRPSPSQ